MSGAAGVQVRFDADRPGQWSAPAEVVWSDGATDVAVLAFTPPAGAEPVGPAPFGRIGDDRHAVVDVHAAGFPLWKRRRDAEGRQFRELHQADGTVAAPSGRGPWKSPSRWPPPTPIPRCRPGRGCRAPPCGRDLASSG
ncbi:hypothetical protein ACFWB1_04285 [Streptomyces goshikiensis]|uniref:hypothetical protein n=1 Tax=Streptomyces goshikiensis TaxID=1942 RepID=UPI0036AD7E5F